MDDVRALSALLLVVAVGFLLVVFHTYLVTSAVVVVVLGALIYGARYWLHLRREVLLPMAEQEAEIEMQRAVTASLKRASESGHHFRFSTGETRLDVLNTGGVVGPLTQIAPQAPQIAQVPSFAESMRAGLIGPSQQKLLMCHELVATDGLLQIRPHQANLEKHSTLFLGGASLSGKTTWMVNLCTQEALLGAVFYLLDPHLVHPERSLAVKLAPLPGRLILPPARTDAEVKAVLTHAKAEAEARLNGIETRWSGHQIVFVVDEVLALIARAQRSDNPEIIALYRDLALFMRDLGTQLAKFGMAGLFASQYVTKDAFKIPRANADFRDGCQSQALFRLPPNQAQAMHLLDRTELREVRTLPQGHGWLGFATGEVIRMASGNVTHADVVDVGRMLPPIVTTRRYATGTDGTRMETGFRPGESARVIDADPVPQWGSEHGGTRAGSGFRPTGKVIDADPAPQRGTWSGGTRMGTGFRSSTSTGTLADEGAVPGTARRTTGVPGGTRRAGKRFTAEQEASFLRAYERTGSIKRAIAALGVSYGDYQAHASLVVRTRAHHR